MIESNKDRPANPLSINTGAGREIYTGYTKKEKAFWDMYAKVIECDFHTNEMSYEEAAIYSINAVNAGFKALDEDEKDED